MTYTPCKEPLKGGFAVFKVCILLRFFVKIHGDPYYEPTIVVYDDGFSLTFYPYIHIKAQGT